MKEEDERRLAALRARNLAPVAKLRRGLRLENSASGNAEMYFYDDIGGWDGIVAKDVVGALNQAGGRPIDLHINSGGGDIFEAHAIHNAIRRYSGKVTGYVDGIAASAASYILMACGESYMEPNAQIMIHDGQGFCMGPADDMRECADLLDLLSDSIAGMYAARAGGEAGEWRARMRATTWYNASQAVAAGLATGIREDAPTNQVDTGAPVGETGPVPIEVDTGSPMAAEVTVDPSGAAASSAAMVTASMDDSPPEWFGGLSSGLKGLFA